MNARKLLIRFINKHTYLYSILVSLFIFTFLNVGSYFYLNYIYKPQLLDSSYQLLEKIHGKKKALDYKLVSIEQTVPLKYMPFVEYVEAERAKKFVNVSNLAIRCNYKQEYNCNSLGQDNEIWVFGGSTTFGYGVKDDETIPAYLAKILPKYHVVNFGAASYYSTIERIRFENLLTYYHKPKAAIFIDGLNDFYYFKVPDESALSPNIQQSLFPVRKHDKDGFLKIVKNKIRRLALYRLLHLKIEKPSTISKISSVSNATANEIDKALRRLEVNHMLISSIAKNLNIKVLFVKQPIPTYGVGHTTSNVPTNMLNFDLHANSGLAYRVMESKKTDLNCSPGCVIDLSKFGIDQPMYVDTVHYTPEFNQAIAERISQKLSEFK